MNTHYTPTEEELTAYVLGEADASQVEAIEAAVESQPETKQLLDAIRETIELSEAVFADIKAEALSTEQRKTVESAASNVIRLPQRKTWEKIVSYAAAGGIVAVIGAALLPNLTHTREADRRATPESLAKQMELEREWAANDARGQSSQMPVIEDRLDAEKSEGNEIGGRRVAGDVVGGQVAGTAGVDLLVSADPQPSRSNTESLGLIEAEMSADGIVAGKDDLPAIAAAEAPVELKRQKNTQLESIAVANVPQAGRPPLTQSSTAATPAPTQLGQTFEFRDSTSQDFGLERERMRFAGVPQSDVYMPAPPPAETPGSETYQNIVENQFKQVSQAPLSTFSIDVDTASYSNVRRFITQGSLPPADSVRIEELINYFDYDYPQPVGEDPFSSSVEIGTAPWNPAHKLVRVGLKGKDIVAEERPNSNLVFLLDVSGSMNSANKLPLVKQSIRLLTEQLTEKDRVAIVVYAGNSGLVLPSTPGNQHAAILDALNRLSAGGSTNGGAGIELAYNIASQHFIEGGVNRVILASDGDFNVGTTSVGGLVELIEQKAKTGVFLSVLGYGMGNLKDQTMENLADKGNGNYAYIDTFHEAKKVLADEMNATLFTIAKDVKIQVEFNPNRVHAYRLIGYENRALANRDFNDDTKDAGEIGAGHTVTALYEIVPTGTAATQLSGNVDALRYQTTEPAVPERAVAESIIAPDRQHEMLTLKLRYKQPEGNTSKLLEFHVPDAQVDFTNASADFRFATAVAAYGMKLRNSPFAQSMTYDTVLQLAESGRGHDLSGYRSEFIDLVQRTNAIAPSNREDLRY